MENKSVTIDVPILARVEGEGALHLTVGAQGIEQVQLRIYEPPRYFEKLLEGRNFHEVTDIVTRICGICPVAYQISAVRALESLCAVDPGPWVAAMRRTYYYGEWIESHCLHMHLLALPDFLGYDSVVEMAVDYPEEVRRGLYLQGLGNELIALFGARSVNPVGARVGGFHHAPSVAVVSSLAQRLRAALPQAQALLQGVCGLPLPQVAQEFTCVALQHSSEYAIVEGDIVSSSGLRISEQAFAQHFSEHQVPHSTALHCLLQGQSYLVGPLARINLNYAQLHPQVRQWLADYGREFPSNNMYHSLVARAAETCHALLAAGDILDAYTVPASPWVAVSPRAGFGIAASEAPRGLLWHHYELDAEGTVRAARIVPPTSQNQARIEQDIRHTLQSLGLNRGTELLRRDAEQVIRNYDPCISCATHFLDLQVHRT